LRISASVCCRHLICIRKFSKEILPNSALKSFHIAHLKGELTFENLCLQFGNSFFRRGGVLQAKSDAQIPLCGWCNFDGAMKLESLSPFLPPSLSPSLPLSLSVSLSVSLCLSLSLSLFLPLPPPPLLSLSLRRQNHPGVNSLAATAQDTDQIAGRNSQKSARPLDVVYKMPLRLTFEDQCSARHKSNRRQKFSKISSPSKDATEWRRPIGCLKLQVTFCNRATKYRAFLREMTSRDKESYGSLPPCI